MIGFKTLLIAATVATSMTATVAASGSVSDNDVVMESIVDESVNDEDITLSEEVEEDVETSVQVEESIEQNDLFESEYHVSDDNISSDIDYTVSSEEGDESKTDDTVSGNDIEYAVMPLADYDTYYGTISTTYVEYFRGYLSKLESGEHYVAARTGQYEYIFAYGADLSYDGSFAGSDVYVVTINTQNSGSFSGGIQTTFSLNPGSYMVYSDLSAEYPALATSSDFSLRQIVYVIGIVIAFFTIDGFFRFKTKSRRWKR